MLNIPESAVAPMDQSALPRPPARICLLITGFGRFPGTAFNPTAPLVRALTRIRRPALTDVQLVPHVFATRYAAVDRDLPALLARHRPDALVMFGLAARTPHLRIETQARNALSGFPDAGGHRPKAHIIADNGPAQMPARLPRAELLRAAKARGARAVLSRDAGCYLCNYVYWRALETAARADGPRLVCFIHVPEIGRSGRPPRPHQRHPSLRDLVRTGEAILLAVVSAVKRT
jgi:pyroglutamyl-peptidase